MSRAAIFSLLAASGIHTVSAAASSHDIHYKSVDADTAKAFSLARRQSGAQQAPLNAVQGFWFSKFTIGNSKNIDIVVDTGSGDLVLNHGVYQPGPDSVDTGVNLTVAYATANPDGSGYDVAKCEIYNDTITQLDTGYTLTQQPVGAIFDPDDRDSFPGKGVMGFGPGFTSRFGLPNFFDNLCNDNVISEQRFGLALRTDETGTIYYGSAGSNEYDGSLVEAPLKENGYWEIYGDVVVNGKTVQTKADIVTDSGTTIILGPIDQVKAVYKAAGIKTIVNSDKNITGTYPCDSPPKIGFAFPAKSKHSTTFNILPEALEFSRDGNVCTASVQGWTDQGESWLVGQRWFLGKYLDHNYDRNSMGFANLKSSS